MCRTVIIDFYHPTENMNRTLFSAARRHGADQIMVLTGSHFDGYGYPYSKSFAARAESLLSCGADLVASVPGFIMQMRSEIIAFSLACMMQRMSIVDQIFLPVTKGREDVIRKISDVLFFEPLSYRKRVSQLSEEGSARETAGHKALSELVPGAEKVLLCPMDLLASEMLLSLKRSYSRVKPVLYPVPAGFFTSEEQKIAPASDRALLEKAEAAFKSGISGKDPEKIQIFGGYRSLYQHLQNGFLTSRAEGFTDFLCEIETPSEPAGRIRRFLFQLMMGFENADHSVLALYSYVPFISVYKNSDHELMTAIQKAAWAPLITDDAAGTDLSGDARAKLLEIEKRSRNI